MARKKQTSQTSSSATEAVPPATPEAPQNIVDSTKDVAPQVQAPESPIEDTLPDQFFAKDSGGDSHSEAAPQLPTPPPAEAPPLRYVAVTMVKAKRRYYSPGTPLPPEALDETNLDELLAAGAIALEQAQS